MGSVAAQLCAGVTAETLTAAWWRHAPRENQRVVAFYHEAGPFGCFSNFMQHAPFPFTLPECCCCGGGGGAIDFGAARTVEVRCSEVAIMLCKAAAMGDARAFDAIRRARTPQEAKRLGRTVAPW